MLLLFEDVINFEGLAELGVEVITEWRLLYYFSFVELHPLVVLLIEHQKPYEGITLGKSVQIFQIPTGDKKFNLLESH